MPSRLVCAWRRFVARFLRKNPKQLGTCAPKTQTAPAPEGAVKKKRKKKQTREEHQSCKLGLLHYNNNSCHLDTTLMILATSMGPELAGYLFGENSPDRTVCVAGGEGIADAIRKAMRDIQTSIEQNKPMLHCADLRRLLARCTKDTTWNGDVRDIIEGFQLIFRLFRIPNLEKREVLSLGSLPAERELWQEDEDFMEETLVTDHPSVLEVLPLDLAIFNGEESYTNSVGEMLIPSMFREKKYPETEWTHITLNAQPIFVLGIQRDDEERVPIEPAQRLTTPSGDLNLCAVVLLDAEHYTAAIRCYDGNFYMYNDLRHNLQNLGGYAKLVLRRDILTRSRALVYAR
jgi:hypothetical protein